MAQSTGSHDIVRCVDCRRRCRRKSLRCRLCLSRLLRAQLQGYRITSATASDPYVRLAARRALGVRIRRD